jgi:diacylglycerol O-acyltransferase
LLDGIVTACFSAVDRMLTAQSELLNFAEHITATMKAGAAADNGNGCAPHGQEVLQLFPEFATPTQRLPFNVVCRGPQKFQWTELPLPDIKALKHHFEVTVNDVVLFLVAATVRRYAEVHGLSTRGRLLRIVVPVSLRDHDETETNALGNRITFVPVTIPLGLRNPQRLLQAIHERTAALKSAHVAEVVGLAGTLLGVIPTAFQAMIGPIASQLPLNVCNLICTNVPGPQAPLYLLGHKMLGFYPYVPIGGEMGMNCAVLTYNGTAFFGFTGDALAMPDIALLPKFLQASFADLQRSAGLAPTRPPRRAPTVAPTSRRTSREHPARAAQSLEQSKPLATAVAAD